MKKIIYKNIVSSKAKLYIFLLLFIIIILNGIDLSINCINNKITNEILNKIENRSIYVISNDLTDKLTEIEPIEHVEHVYYDLSKIEVEYNGILNYAKIFNPFLQKYDNIKFLEENEVIISERLCVNFHLKIGDEISLSHYNQSFVFKIKEIYSETDKMENYIYISNNNELINSLNNKNEYFVLIDSSYNYNEVMDNLELNGCKLKFKDVKYENELLIYKDILFSLNFFFIIIYSILILCFFVILILNITEKKYSIALLKNFGYSNYSILKIILFEHFFFIIIIYILNILFFQITSYCLSFFRILNFLNIYIIMKNFFIMVILLMLASLFLILKIKKISLIKLLKNL